MRIRELQETIADILRADEELLQGEAVFPAVIAAVQKRAY